MHDPAAPSAIDAIDRHIDRPGGRRHGALSAGHQPSHRSKRKRRPPHRRRLHAQNARVEEVDRNRRPAVTETARTVEVRAALLGLPETRRAGVDHRRPRIDQLIHRRPRIAIGIGRQHRVIFVARLAERRSHKSVAALRQTLTQSRRGRCVGDAVENRQRLRQFRVECRPAVANIRAIGIGFGVEECRLARRTHTIGCGTIAARDLCMS